jgi:integrase
MDVLSVVEGHPLLAGDGLILVNDAAQIFGLDPKTILTEAANGRVNLICIANGWRGIEVADLRDVERDYDGTFIFNDLKSLGQPVVATGNLVIYDTKVAATAFQGSGEYLAEIAFRDENRRSAIFFDPAEKVEIGSLLLSKNAAEIIRLRLSAGVTSVMIETAKTVRLSASAIPAPAPVSTPALHKYGGLRASELIEQFLEEKSAVWKTDQYKRMLGVCNVFPELMGDPTLTEIDRSMIIDYRTRLQTLPDNLYQSRRRHGVESLSDLIKAADKAGEPRMSLETANDYIRKLSEMFNWAVIGELIPRNPANKVGVAAKRKRREQDDRSVFDKEDMAQVFGADWFLNGVGKKDKRGGYSSYQPHYYWLPLLGLLSGGRLNELSQLYLDDILQSEDGCWFLDFNLEGANKIAVDPKDETILSVDKSLKTVNSQRVVALHESLVVLVSVRV